MLFTRPGFRLWLALLLLFSQQQALLHALGHGFAQLSALERQHDAGDPQELVCAKCLAIAHLDHAVSASIPILPAVEATYPRIAALAPPHLDLAFFASYRSRAPPVLS